LKIISLEGKVAIVTGASRGLGKSMAVELARDGALVVVAARTTAPGQTKLPGTIHETVNEIEKLGGKAVAVRCDVADEGSVNQMIEEVQKRHGGIDILINNAGVTTTESFITMPVKKWDLVMNVNLRGTFLCCKAVLPQMIQRKSGHIINLSSVLASTIRFSIPYGCSKAAIERFTRGLAKEVKKYHVAVNALCPDFTVTEAVEAFLKDVDTSSWQRPEMWGRYAALLAAKGSEDLTGRILDEPTLKEIFGPVAW
jgi:citronellol/citronellal dehydrogenase